MSTTFTFALLSGILPALLWLWFWLHEDNLHPEPRLLIFFTFIGGMLAVPFVIPLQKIIGAYFLDPTVRYILWAASEEMVKFLAAYFFVLRTRYMDEPIDAVIYMITVALGFAALENAFFLLKPLAVGDVMRGLVTGNLRFIGATLLHVVSSAAIGFFIALPYFKSRIHKIVDLSFGILFATALHTAFNLFIIRSEGSDTFIIFACVWVAVVLMILLFEKVKNVTPPQVQLNQ